MTTFQCERLGEVRSFETFARCQRFVMREGGRSRLWSYLGEAQRLYEEGVESYKRVTVPLVSSYRIRHCEGAKEAWCLIRLRADGTEIDSYGGYTTSYSLDLLLKHAGHLTPRPGDKVELVMGGAA